VVQRLAVLGDVGLAVAKGASRRRSELSGTPYPRPVRLPGALLRRAHGGREDAGEVRARDPLRLPPFLVPHQQLLECGSGGLGCGQTVCGVRVRSVAVVGNGWAGRTLALLPASLKDLESEQSPHGACPAQAAAGAHAHGGRGKVGTPVKSADKVRGGLTDTLHSLSVIHLIWSGLMELLPMQSYYHDFHWQLPEDHGGSSPLAASVPALHPMHCQGSSAASPAHM